VAEALFLKIGANGAPEFAEVVLDAGVWKKDGQALTAEEQRLRNVSSVVWKADVTPLTPIYRFEEGGRSETEVEINAQVDLDRPDGCNQVLVLGEVFEDPDYPTFAIDFEPES
jgi:hypothetical protein